MTLRMFFLSELLLSHAIHIFLPIHTFSPRKMMWVTMMMMNVFLSNPDDVLRWMMNVFGRGFPIVVKQLESSSRSFEMGKEKSAQRVMCV